MERQFQLELFKPQQYQSVSSKRGEEHPNFFGFIRIHEKIILIIITLFITSLISFSLGVEKGKRLVISQTYSKKGQAEPDKSEGGQVLKVLKKKDISKYTVQVATFKTRVYAQKEAERLEKKGLKALIVPKGNFVCVCVGNFSKKQEARGTLNQLKKVYQDCFVRRL